MRVKLCEKCPYTPLDLADHYKAEAALHLCVGCDGTPATYKKHQGLAELSERYSTLTSREQQIMDLLSEGFKPKKIAEGLGVLTHTIRVHRGRIMSKMAAQSVSDLVHISEMLGTLGRAANHNVWHPMHHRSVANDIPSATLVV